jgi:DNA-binding FadR family transcriptional regulator
LEIVDAVCAKDPERAAAAMEKHLKSVATAIMRAAEEPGS